MAEPLKPKSPNLPRACFNHTVIQEKLNVNVAKAKQSSASSYRRAHEGKDGKNRNVFLPWVESGGTEEAWKRKKEKY